MWNPFSSQDDHAQPAPGINAERRVERDLAEMLGLAKGVLFDGLVTDTEARRLLEWTKTHPEVAEHWPGSVLCRRLREIFSDGRVSDEERADLKETLEALVGGKVGMISGETITSKLPLDEPPPGLEIPNRVFVLTGRFAYGPRKICENATCAVGGWTESGVTKRTDYLVLGTFASRDWINTSYGRKIEKAVEYRDRFGHPAIISEDYWATQI